MAWFDMDLSSKPYRTMLYHKDEVTGVAFHSRFPLFASSSSDGSVHVFHGQVFQARLCQPHHPVLAQSRCSQVVRPSSPT